ncbi:MAG: tRNA (adenosine(37)-N6)-threonylcarbamoyltransferase complex transferase subunit TsaD [Candidatus Omnitrophota bacterium]|jgi:N6-L-threonylcarbamoyladenine synthase
MIVLGIETSCDETSAAVVKNGRKVMSNVVASSLNFHKKFGGIVPEIASRKQLEAIVQVTDSAIKSAKITLKDIGLITVTAEPGLPGSLLVGTSFSKAVSLSLNVPLLSINHVYSHIYANFLNSGRVKLPFTALVVSGGHTSLFYVKSFSRIEPLGRTLDDACGEAFDKVAKILGLSYPGGPAIERLAKEGNGKRFKFRCSGTKNALDFSFSGIKTAVLYAVRNKRLLIKDKKDIAASFQEVVFDTLIAKSFLACKIKKTTRLVFGGGVIANMRLREKFKLTGQAKGINCYFPPKILCMDNAAMVAGLGYQLRKHGGYEYAHG